MWVPRVLTNCDSSLIFCGDLECEPVGFILADDVQDRPLGRDKLVPHGVSFGCHLVQPPIECIADTPYDVVWWMVGGEVKLPKEGCMSVLQGALTRVRRVQRQASVLVISIIATTAVVLAATAPAHAARYKQGPSGGGGPSHGSVIRLSSGAYVANPPYPNNPVIPSNDEAADNTELQAHAECNRHNVTIDNGVKVSRCATSWVGLCWKHHNWARACAATYYVRNYSPGDPMYWVYTATFYSQKIDGHTAEIQPFAEWTRKNGGCGPGCGDASDRR